MVILMMQLWEEYLWILVHNIIYHFSHYYALIYPYFTYCNLIWASTYVTNRQRIYQLQKRAVLGDL